MISDCDASAGVRMSVSKAGLPEAVSPGSETAEIEQALDRILSSLLALAEERKLPTVCQAIVRLRQKAEAGSRSSPGMAACPLYPDHVRRILNELRLLLDLRIHMTRVPVGELNAKSAEMEKYLAYAEWEFKDTQVSLKNEVARLAGIYAMRASQFAETAVGPLSEEIREQFRSLDAADRSARATRMNTFLQTRVLELLGDWRTPFEESSMELFRHAASRFIKHACELISSIRSAVGSIFEFTVVGAEAWEESGYPECCICFAGHDLDCSAGSNSFFFTPAQFRRHLLRNTLRNTGPDLLRCASRAAEDHKGHLESCCADLIERMSQQFDETREELCGVVDDSLCTQRQGDSAAVAREVTLSLDALAELDRHGKELDLLLCQWERAAGDCRCSQEMEPNLLRR